MKRKKLLLATLLLPAVCHAQSVVEYTYDNAGNRLTQMYPNNNRQGGFGDRQEDAFGMTITGELAGHSIRIISLYGQGTVKVEVLGLQDSDDCIISVYAISGRLLINQKTDDVVTTLDMSDCRRGIYIIKIRLNGQAGSWKTVIK
jgi:hypothetical protein